MMLTTLGALCARATIMRSLGNYLFFYLFFAIIFCYAVIAEAEKEHMKRLGYLRNPRSLKEGMET